MLEHNIRLRVEFFPATNEESPGRELRLVDETSGLIITAARLDAEQFTRMLAGNGVQVDAWFLPPSRREHIGRHRGSVTVHFDRFRTDVAELTAWANRTADDESFAAERATVGETNHSRTVTFELFGDEPLASSAKEALEGQLARSAVERGFVLDSNWAKDQKWHAQSAG